MPDAASATFSDEDRGGHSATFRGLVLVSTPIGNLGDITLRAKLLLDQCNLILCEDTRHTNRLLTTFGIHTRTETLHEHNEDIRIPIVLARLREGQTIALVSDAGTPLMSDPGFRLVRAAISAGVGLTALPGPNAAVTALILSGLPPSPFMFLGFPPAKQSARRAGFSQIRSAERAGLAATLIWYEAPHRLMDTLADLLTIFGNRQAAVARELTKVFETVERGGIAELLELFRRQPPRGEITLMIGKPEADDPEALDERLRQALMTHSVKDAAALVSTATGLPRRLVYTRALQMGGGHDQSTSID
jgi:16S rRNA (cytidine1402-2'-O)-methyltransferase